MPVLAAIRRQATTIIVSVLLALISIAITAYLYQKGRISPPYHVSFISAKIPMATTANAPSALQLYVQPPGTSPIPTSPSRASSRLRTPANLLPVRNLVAVKITIRNHGPQPVRPTDYISPLQLTSRRCTILSATLGQTSREDLTPHLAQPTRQLVSIDPALLESGDYFSVDLILADDPDPASSKVPLLLSGHIINVRDYALHPSTDSVESSTHQTQDPFAIATPGFYVFMTVMMVIALLVNTWATLRVSLARIRRAYEREMRRHRP